MEHQQAGNWQLFEKLLCVAAKQPAVEIKSAFITLIMAGLTTASQPCAGILQAQEAPDVRHLEP
jgi:hypothetical protein